MSKRLTLGKNERLKSRKAIEQLFKDGKSFSVSPFKVFYRAIAIKKNSLQFGVGVSAKNFRKAVDRNRIKRLTKEAYRLQKNELAENLKSKQQALDVFFIYTGREMPSFQLAFDKVNVILKKLTKVFNENDTSNS